MGGRRHSFDDFTCWPKKEVSVAVTKEFLFPGGKTQKHFHRIHRKLRTSFSAVALVSVTNMIEYLKNEAQLVIFEIISSNIFRNASSVIIKQKSIKLNVKISVIYHKMLLIKEYFSKTPLWYKNVNYLIKTLGSARFFS